MVQGSRLEGDRFWGHFRCTCQALKNLRESKAKADAAEKENQAEEAERKADEAERLEEY